MSNIWHSLILLMFVYWHSLDSGKMIYSYIYSNCTSTIRSIILQQFSCISYILLMLFGSICVICTHLTNFIYEKVLCFLLDLNITSYFSKGFRWIFSISAFFCRLSPESKSLVIFKLATWTWRANIIEVEVHRKINLN